MKRVFHPSCEGCANFILFNHFADQGDALEKIVAEDPDLVLKKEGYVGCWREGNSWSKDYDNEGSDRTCSVRGAIAPEIAHVIIRDAGLTAYSEVTVAEVPEPVGLPLHGGGYYVKAADLLIAHQRLVSDPPTGAETYL